MTTRKAADGPQDLAEIARAQLRDQAMKHLQQLAVTLVCKNGVNGPFQWAEFADMVLFFQPTPASEN